MTSRHRSTCRRTAVGLLRRVFQPWSGTRRRTERRGGSCCRSVSSILPIEKSPSTGLHGCRERKLDSRDCDARFHERELRFGERVLGYRERELGRSEPILGPPNLNLNLAGQASLTVVGRIPRAEPEAVQQAPSPGTRRAAACCRRHPEHEPLVRHPAVSAP